MAEVTVAVPTRDRAGALARSLATIAPQSAAVGARLLVILDGPDPAAAAAAAEHGAEVVVLDPPRGLNAARNAAIDRAGSGADDLLILCDDDVDAPPGWLAAHLAGARAHPDHDVLGGAIRPRIDGGGLRACGREPAPITALDLGQVDRDATYVWGANLALRPRAVERAGRFDERLHGRGDEEEWLDRLHRAGGRVGYLGAAGLAHVRSGPDARVGALVRASYRTGRAARANDRRKGTAPRSAAELRDLAGGLYHLLARRCGYGLLFCAHALGRIRELIDPDPVLPAVPVASADDPRRTRPEPFTSGQSGYVAGPRRITAARVRDAGADTRRLLERRRLRTDAAAWGTPREVTVLALERAGEPNGLDAALDELRRSRHRLTILRAEAGDRGRFENLNRLLAGAPDAGGADWLLVIDDDVTLPAGFLDAFLFLAERVGLSLAQPAHRAYSHAAWAVTRRRPGAALRETAFVEIGPLLALHSRTFGVMLPFPEPRIGWGVDAHWGAVAREQGWRVGVVDATAIAHRLRKVAAAYDATSAIAESRAFLDGRPHLTAAEAARTLRTHRRW